ncbi:UNVERIFIED_CONTAM: hypothetical protein K2H54_016625 [Gekko kuhli]
MLIHQMAIVDAVILQTLLEQLRCSPVYKHRVDSAKLLAAIGLEAIQQERLEDKVFDVLLEKLSEEPLLYLSVSPEKTLQEQEWRTFRDKHRMGTIVRRESSEINLLLFY